MRLATSTFGPYSIATGSNGAAQTVEAYNAGDGSLALTASSSATWLSATVGGPSACSSLAKPSCLPVRLAFQTSALATGTYTGVITLSDPNAVDAPQTLTVTVKMGGGIPDRIDLYVAPNGSSDRVSISANNYLSPVKSGDWMAISASGAGSYSFGTTYLVTGTHQPYMTEGDYTGVLGFSGSTFAADNKNLAVTLHVTSRPLASLPAKLVFNAVQGSARQEQQLVVNNRGLGTLAVTAVTTNTTPAGIWLSTGAAGTTTVVSADPAGLAPGTYNGNVVLTTNAANGNVTVPVELVVAAVSAPSIFYRGAVTISTYSADDAVAPGDIVSVWGSQFTDQTRSAPSLPLPTQLGGTRVLVNGVAAPLYYASAGQVNIQIPFETPNSDAGTEAVVKVERDGQAGNSVGITVKNRAPHILPFLGYGVIFNYSRGVTIPMPPTSGIPSARAQVGDVLVIYITGLGQSNPPVATGAGAPVAEPLARIPAAVKVHFGDRFFGGGVDAEALYVGMTGGLAGLYQVNVAVPAGAPTGDKVPLYLDLGDRISNSVLIAIE